jgi:pimeloyl-ACP methyl ester carboxylesterase
MSKPSRPMQQGFASTDDGLQIFYRSVGEGDQAIVCCNGIGVSTGFWEYVVDAHSANGRVVVWDYRGHGRSQDPTHGHDLDIPRHARDLGVVCDALGLEAPVLAGHSMGSQVILERYRQAPDRVRGLVSILGTYGHPLDTFSDLPFSRQLFDLIIAVSQGLPRTFDIVAKLIVSTPLAHAASRRLNLVDPNRCAEEDLTPYLRHLVDVGFPFFFKMAEVLGEHSALDLLRDVAVPTLVIAGEFDAFTPPHLAQRLHDSLPDSELVWLKGASHAGIIEQPGLINEAIGTLMARVSA